MLTAWKRPENGIWYYRRAIPIRLRATLGKTEFRISLKTRDPREARRALPLIIAAVDAALGQGQLTPSPAPIFQTFASPPEMPQAGPAPVPAKPAVTFGSLMDGWAMERSAPSRTVYEWRRVFDRFADHLGHDDAARVAKTDIVAWKDALFKAGRTTKCISGYLAGVRAVLGWAERNAYISVNPAAGVIVKASKGAATAGKSRLPYTDEQTRLILGGARKLNGFKRWLPFLLAYTGARLNEICQLHVGDVREAPEGWFLSLNCDDQGKSLKTAGSARNVPVHSALIEEGFIDFVKTRSNGPLFPDCHPDLSVQLLELARERERMSVADAVLATEANRNTIKDHLRTLSAQGHLLRHGAGRGVWYSQR